MKATQTSGQQKTVVSVLVYRADGVYIGELGPDPVYGPTASEAGGWIPVKHTLSAGQPQALPSGTSWFDSVQFEESPDASAFVAGDQYTANASGMQTAGYDGDGLKELYQYNDQQNLTEYWQDPQNYKLITKYNWDSNKLSTVTDPTKRANACNTPNTTTEWDIKTGADKKVDYNFHGQPVSAYRDPKTGYWWARDTTGHGESSFKVFKAAKGGKELHWIADSDKYGNFIKGKHKSSTGTIIKIK
ncbi:hypothetical protein OS242_11025 [Tumebacillus sp. DT12]|uniref:Uncharacterized protein n=1 Tax=Tumebacillus lacus TaxID=2995335 RepID=A0ABT3X0S2_9BACL|nr:hypothetical protein [Tumebacillus lacus]MCX7570494.1 hypothetical protein [Tumebacillus lacus]